ncbi:alpha-E domain-containing protein [Corticibacter populi]|uniref:Alpha-E domain-containing protein n=1 Tax=Corticibacter populi TaxID=1550736 RepID=A0A3M6QZI4_9BURK|nr:alpha-E domain-containing protein [Corticibacter populi]RMX08427.1 alpha-E domain-containing protein [Corticibacter populi]RZS35733.1 putative alpha-E superfamily protein [Corticibacter populi]
MLSSTADHIFWMSRYVERAENTARMLNVNLDTALLPQSRDAMLQGWMGILSISELQDDYTSRYGKITPEQVLDFMVLDPLNPSSIYSCLREARENARAVRGALTTEVWESHNMSWLELGRLVRDPSGFKRDPGRFFEWVKYRSHLSRGVALGTMLQNEAFHFLRLGTFLERADNTARLLDVKFHALESSTGRSAQELQPRSQMQEYYHWVALLRSVSAFEIYRQVYRDVVSPKRIAELLILRSDMPRSLLACLTEVVRNLESIANDHSAKTQRRAGRLLADLQYSTIDEILANGLHAFLVQFLERVNDLGAGVSKDFLVH